MKRPLLSKCEVAVSPLERKDTTGKGIAIRRGRSGSASFPRDTWSSEIRIQIGQEEPWSLGCSNCLSAHGPVKELNGQKAVSVDVKSTCG